MKVGKRGRLHALKTGVTAALLPLVLMSSSPTTWAHDNDDDDDDRGRSRHLRDGRQINVEIRRTSFGIPHIRATDHLSLAYGIGYAFAQDNLCLMADRFVTVRGERSRHFGPADQTVIAVERVANIDSDFFFRSYFDDARLTSQYARTSRKARDLVRGYALGFNRYLAETPVSKRPAACGSAEWVRPITPIDVYRSIAAGAVLASGGALAPAITNAQPPAAVTRAPAGVTLPEPEYPHLAGLPGAPESALGSNGVAIGAALSENGRGIVLGNPHFAWNTALRFYQMHLTIPGRLDVMGAALAGFPMVQIGFNESVAWSHTTSAGVRFTLYELTLAAGDPTSYVFEGETRPMSRRVVTIDVKTSTGAVVPFSRTLYSSQFGPLLINPRAGLNWTPLKAYAIRDANVDNVRLLDQWLAMARADNVQELKAAQEKHLGLPWVTTVAADRHGNALFTDISVKPNVPAAQFAACTQFPLAQGLFFGAGIVLMDGSRQACEWRVNAAPLPPDALPPAELPSLQRTDFVQNSNDSFWLTNPAQLLSGYSPVAGIVGPPQRLRTRTGLTQIADRISNADGLGGNRFSAEKLETILFANRNFAAELTVDAFVPLCKAVPLVPLDATTLVDVSDACSRLEQWDKRNNAESVGVQVFREFWARVRVIPNLFATPFNPADPVGTPRNLNVSDPTVRTQLLGGFALAVQALRQNGVALDAPWGSVFYQRFGADKVAGHGGPETDGVYNKVDIQDIGILTTLKPGNPGGVTPAGYTPISFGSSYIQVVTFDRHGPIADAILTYGQSSNPDSPHFRDQTERLFAVKQWLRLPFTERRIEGDAALTRLRLRGWCGDC
jgi:acyl-homoserine-lactone acylase